MIFSAKLTGADKIQLGIRSLGMALPDIVNDDVKEAMELAAKMSIPYAGGASYRVDLPDSGRNYRTGNLGRSVMVWQRGATHVIEVAAYRRGREYTKYVIGDREGQGQAGSCWRWTPMREAVDLYLDRLVDTTEQHIQEAIDKHVG